MHRCAFLHGRQDCAIRLEVYPVVDGKLGHGGSGFDCGATDMRGQHHIAQGAQVGWNMWLVFKDIEPGHAKRPVFQRDDQGHLVHHRATPDINQDTIGAKRIPHLSVHKVMRRCPARRDTDQCINVPRHRGQVVVVGIGHVAGVAPAIKDSSIERGQLCCDCHADPVQAQDADGAVVDTARIWEPAIGFPAPRTGLFGIGKEDTIAGNQQHGARWWRPRR